MNETTDLLKDISNELIELATDATEMAKRCAELSAMVEAHLAECESHQEAHAQS